MRFAQASAPIPGCLPEGGRRRQVLRVATAALAVASLAAGCQAGTSAGGTPATTSTITVAAIRGVDTAPLFIAIKDGAFARAGLKVQYRSYPSVAQELQALSKGNVDIASGDYADFFYLASKSAHPYLSIVADGYHAAPGVMEILTYPGSGINSPQDLAGKVIGTTQAQGIPFAPSSTPGVATKPYSIETLAAQSVLTNNGVNVATIKWRPMPAGTLVNALASHKIAAILVDEPYIYQAESKLGAYPVLDACSGATANLPLSGYFATSAFVKQHAQALDAFRRVLLQAQKAAVLPGPVRTELLSDPGMTMTAASLVTIGSYPTTLNAPSLQRVADLMFNFEILNQALNVSSMVSG